MQIHVKIPNLQEFSEKMFLESIRYYADVLLEEKHKEELKITCQISDTLNSENKAVVLHNIRKHLQETQTEFLILISEKEIMKNDLPDLLESLAHEMIHVKQNLTGDLVFLRNNTLQDYAIVWKNKIIIGIEKLSEKNKPWEQEPYEESKNLFESFLLTWNHENR